MNDDEKKLLIQKILKETEDRIQPGVASFNIQRKRNYKTTELIISIIEKSVIEQKQITRDDIIALYWIYKTEGETKSLDYSREWIEGEGWQNVSMTKDFFINHWRMQRNAISWFRSGLSAAILEGKLLVLPVINI